MLIQSYQAIISDNAQIAQFIIEDLALVLQIIFGKRYSYQFNIANYDIEFSI